MIINADCLAGMNILQENTIDAVITDPPYGLGTSRIQVEELLRCWLAGEEYKPNGGKGILGADWDTVVPHPGYWREALRVLKPGGYLLAFSGSKTSHYMAMSLQLAGFDVVEHLQWIYSSGMPKGLNVSKTFDKKRAEHKEIYQVTAWIKQARIAAGISNGDIDRAFGFNGMAGHWTSSRQQPTIPTVDQVPQLLEILGNPEIPADISRLIFELNGTKGTYGEDWHNREVTGHHAEECHINRWSADFMDKKPVPSKKITAPASELAKKWEGWNTGLKPQYEPIIVCRKPLYCGKFVPNIEKYGVGAYNIDACRYEGGRWPGTILHDGCIEPARYFYSTKTQKEDRGEGNNHPTVKPTELMRWLCRLVTPPGGTVLDPFAGSGSTGKAAVLEGFKFLGFEQNREYAEIAKNRIKKARE